jgi:hypothetical protein
MGDLCQRRSIGRLQAHQLAHKANEVFVTLGEDPPPALKPRKTLDILDMLDPVETMPAPKPWNTLDILDILDHEITMPELKPWKTLDILDILDPGETLPVLKPWKPLDILRAPLEARHRHCET